MVDIKGVGTCLKELIKTKYHIGATAGCECNRRAREMDANGIAWCEGHFEEIVSWLMEGAAERVWIRPLVWLFENKAEHAARELLREAIEEAKGAKRC